MDKKSEEFLICILVGFYLVVNFFTNNIKGSILFIVIFAILQLILNNLLLACTISYTLSIIYGVYSKYHLFENFTENITHSTNIKKTNFFEGLKTLISDRLLNNYIKQIKSEDNTMIKTRQVKIIELTPSISELRAGKIKNMKLNKKVLDKPIVITNDNKIIDGHHRWYIKKSQINTADEDDDSNYIKAVIISLDFHDFINNIKDFKMRNNELEMNRINIDKHKLDSVKESIATIKDSIEIINKNYKDLEQLNIM
jgi:hypothetical protein